MSAAHQGRDVLAIDAGTTRRHRPRGHRARARSPPAATRSSAQHFPHRAGSSTRRRRSGRPPWRPPATASRPGTGSPATSPASGSPTSARRCCSGTARRSAPRDARSCGRTGVRPTSAARLRDEGHEDRVTELTGLRLDPYFSGTKLVWLAENEPNTWALVERGPLRDRHGRLLPDRPDDARHLARHRRLQRLPHPALRPRGGRLVRGAVRPVRRADGRAARDRAQLG